MMKMNNGISTEEKFYRAAWQSLSLSGASYVAALLENFDSCEEAWSADDKTILTISRFQGTGGASILADRRSRPDYPQRLLAECEKKNIFLSAIGDEAYPSLLQYSYNPPQIIFYRGRLTNTERRIAIVGSRKVTPYGRSVAECLAKELAAKGINIVSGGAIGVDTEAHRGAIRRGVTEAVLGCGVDVAYPVSNRRLLDEIAEKGAVISEYPPSTPPNRMLFPIRNRIISGMSRGTIVVEAAEKSGSLITADLAMNEGRDVFAVPGSIFSNSSRGCNRLIQQGAKLITGSADVLAEYSDWQEICQGNLFYEIIEESEDSAVMKMGKEEKRIYDLLTYDVPLTIDEIIYRLKGGKVNEISCLLLQMELKRLVRNHAGGGYTKAV